MMIDLRHHGEQQLDAGNHPAALELHARLYRKDGADAQDMLVLGSLQTEPERFGAARQTLEKSLTLEKSAEACYSLASINRRRRTASTPGCKRLYDWSQGGESIENPVFIVGMPRSGASLVEHILSSHSGVHGGGELRNMIQMVAVPQNIVNGGKRFYFV